jgi:hypothetical protein
VDDCEYLRSTCSQAIDNAVTEREDCSNIMVRSFRDWPATLRERLQTFN